METYTDAVVIVDRIKNGVIERFRVIKYETLDVGFTVNYLKIQHLLTSRVSMENRDPFEVDVCSFVSVLNFSYLGPCIQHK